MQALIQTWFSFNIHGGINGREWLARRSERDGLRYVRQDNCFPWVEDPQRAQRLLNQQFRGAVLLELFPMRMGHRCTVAAGDSGTVGAADVASRPAALLPSGYPAILRSAHSLGGHGAGAFFRGNHDQ